MYVMQHVYRRKAAQASANRYADRSGGKIVKATAQEVGQF